MPGAGHPVLWEKNKSGDLLQQYVESTDEAVGWICKFYEIHKCDPETMDDIFNDVANSRLNADRVLPRSRFKSHVRHY